MDGFQKFVLFAAIIILIIALIFIGIALSSANITTWPPMTPDCPDWWISDGSGNLAICTNIKDLGICPPQSGKQHLTIDFNGPAFTGSNGTCAKYQWAKKCKVSWDGITYGVNNPCQTPSS
jgi:hypothetical protein